MFKDFLNEDTAAKAEAFFGGGNAPHAVIINSQSKAEREKLALAFAMRAVCQNDADKPCGTCPACVKAQSNNHSDIYFAKGSGKTDIISIDEIRRINRDSVIIANESSVKVYILSDADKRLKPEAQNAFLKTLEEPVQNTLFLLTAENFKALLPTVLSRATVFATGGDYKNSGGEYAEAAQAIAAAIIKTEEYPLLQGFSRFNKRDEFAEVVAELLAIFRDALAVTSGAKALQSGNTAVLLAQKLRKADILELIDTTNILNDRLYKNVNINLLATWACAEFRRIVWQR